MSPDKVPQKLDVHGINTVLGTRNYSILLVPFHGTPLPSHKHMSDDRGETLQDVLKALDDPKPQFLFAILTIRCFEGWQDLTAEDWQYKTVQLLEQDKAHSSLIRKFKDDVIPQTIGKPWQVVSCDPRHPVPYEGGRVVLIGDAAHAMSPQS